MSLNTMKNLKIPKNHKESLSLNLQKEPRFEIVLIFLLQLTKLLTKHLSPILRSVKFLLSSLKPIMKGGGLKKIKEKSISKSCQNSSEKNWILILKEWKISSTPNQPFITIFLMC